MATFDKTVYLRERNQGTVRRHGGRLSSAVRGSFPGPARPAARIGVPPHLRVSTEKVRLPRPPPPLFATLRKYLAERPGPPAFSRKGINKNSDPWNQQLPKGPNPRFTQTGLCHSHLPINVALPAALTSQAPVAESAAGNEGVATPPLALSVATRFATQDGGYLRPFPETPTLGSQKPLQAATAAAAAAAAAPTGRGAERSECAAPPTEGGAGTCADSGILIGRGRGGSEGALVRSLIRSFGLFIRSS